MAIARQRACDARRTRVSKRKPSASLSSAEQAADAGVGQEDTNTQVQSPGKQVISRSVKSFRMRDDLSHRIEILAAEERRKIYEVVEEALEEYLARRQR